MEAGNFTNNILSGEYYQPPKKYNPDEVSPIHWQMPLDEFFSNGFWSEVPGVVIYEVFTQNIPQSDKVEFMESLFRRDRLDVSLRSYAENNYGRCHIERSNEGIAVEFYDGAGTKWRTELDWWECADYLSQMIEDDTFKPKHGLEQLEELQKEHPHVSWIKSVAKDGLAFLAQLPEERQSERISRLKQVFKLLGMEHEIETAWNNVSDVIMAANDETIWHGRQIYEHLLNDVIATQKRTRPSAGRLIRQSNSRPERLIPEGAYWIRRWTAGLNCCSSRWQS